MKRAEAAMWIRSRVDHFSFFFFLSQMILALSIERKFDETRRGSYVDQIQG